MIKYDWFNISVLPPRPRGLNFEIPVGLFRPAPGFLAALEPRQVNQRERINSRLRSLRRIVAPSPLRLPRITGDRECCAPAYSRGSIMYQSQRLWSTIPPVAFGRPPVRSARPI